MSRESWASEGRIVEAAVGEMQRQGVAVTPARVQTVVNAVDAAGQVDNRRIREIEAELARAADVNIVVALADDGTTTAVRVPVPYFALSPAKRTELEHQAAALKGIIDDRQSHPAARRRAQTELDQVERLLQLDDGSGPPSPPAPDRSSSSREVARPEKRNGLARASLDAATGGAVFAAPVPYWEK